MPCGPWIEPPFTQVLLARVPHLKGVIGLHDVGIALGCISWQLRFCCHLALKGDAQTRSTLDALLALNTIRTNRTLDTRLVPVGLGRPGRHRRQARPCTPWASLRAGITVRTLERTGGNPGHGRAAAQGPERTLPIAVGELG